MHRTNGSRWPTTPSSRRIAALLIGTATSTRHGTVAAVSIVVALDDLAGEVAAREWCYLISTRTDGRPHAVAVRPEMDGVIVVGVGNSTRANVSERPLVTLVWPPVEPDGYSLIVDGTVNVTDADHNTVTITPTWAVLHRPA
jgi:hypothetical protein